ncbi:hypothetical protein K5549_009891, partial [Capra hircus]
MRSAAVLALLLCAGQVIALPVNSPMNKGDTEVMKCIVEVISDTLSKPSPMPVSKECFETLRGDERILSILRHQNLLKELQDLALQGARERTQQQKQRSSYEDGPSEGLEKPDGQAKPKEGMEEVSSKDAAEKRDDSKEVEKSDEDSDGDRPQASPELGPGFKVEEDKQAPREEEEEAPSNAHPLASLPSPKHPGPQAKEDSEGPSQGPAGREKGLSAEQGRQTEREEEEEKGEEAEAGEKAVPEEESPTTAAFKPPPSLGNKETQRAAPGWPEALAVDGARKMGAEEAKSREGKGEWAHSRQEEEEMAGAQVLFRGGKSGEPEQEEQLSKEWEDAKRWSKMDQLAKGADSREAAGGGGGRGGPRPLHEALLPGPGLRLQGPRAAAAARLEAKLPGGQRGGRPAPPGARLPRGEEGGGGQCQPQARGPGAGELVGHRGRAGEGVQPAGGAAAGL